MRPAILYTLEATEIVAGDYYLLRRANLCPVWTANPAEAIAPINEDRFAVPVHRVSRCPGFKTDPLRVDPWISERYKYEDVFFAVEPALAEILEAPFKDKVTAANEKLRKAEEVAQHHADRWVKVSAQLIRTEGTISWFNNLPWWKRAYLAATGGLWIEALNPEPEQSERRDGEGEGARACSTE